VNLIPLNPGPVPAQRAPPIERCRAFQKRLADQGVPYRMMNADPEYYPGQIIEKDLASGTIDAAVVWGPIAGFYAKRSTQPKMIVVPLPSEPGVDFDYEIAMGVRRGEPEWKATVERLIDQNRDRIEQILHEYGDLRTRIRGFVELLSGEDDPEQIEVVTSDRTLAARVRALGASTRGARAFLDSLDGLDTG